MCIVVLDLSFHQNEDFRQNGCFFLLGKNNRQYQRHERKKKKKKKELF